MTDRTSVSGRIELGVDAWDVSDLREFLAKLEEYNVKDNHPLAERKYVSVVVRGPVTTIQCGCERPGKGDYIVDALVMLHECEENK